MADTIASGPAAATTARPAAMSASAAIAESRAACRRELAAELSQVEAEVMEAYGTAAGWDAVGTMLDDDEQQGASGGNARRHCVTPTATAFATTSRKCH